MLIKYSLSWLPSVLLSPAPAPIPTLNTIHRVYFDLFVATFCLQSPAKRTEKEAAEQDQFFKDGVRKIDYVLAFRKDTKEGEDEEKRAKRRKEYFANLKEEGLHMEEVKWSVFFCKI